MKGKSKEKRTDKRVRVWNNNGKEKGLPPADPPSHHESACHQHENHATETGGGTG